MALKIAGLGCFDYLSSPFNAFDCFIVTSGLIEYAFASDGGTISVLRAFRILRIFKLLKKSGGLKTLIITVFKSSVDSINLGLLILLFLFVNAVIGKQLFEGEVKDIDGNISRTGFENFENSLVTVFVCMTGSWVEPMNDIVRNGSKWSIIYFLEIVIFGNFFLMSLFITILL